jgi:hypothetical protein
MKRR